MRKITPLALMLVLAAFAPATASASSEPALVLVKPALALHTDLGTARDCRTSACSVRVRSRIFTDYGAITSRLRWLATGPRSSAAYPDPNCQRWLADSTRELAPAMSTFLAWDGAPTPRRLRAHDLAARFFLSAVNATVASCVTPGVFPPRIPW
jgi:hypothetical protein